MIQVAFNRSIKLTVTLVALLLMVLNLSSSSTAASLKLTFPAPQANSKSEDSSNIYVIKGGGIQFVIPEGWKVEQDKNGNVVASVAEGAVSVTFVVEEQFEGVVQGMKDGLKEKFADLKSDGKPKEGTHNGMSHISESGSATLEKHPVIWSIDVVKARKPVIVFTFGITSVIESHQEDYAKLVQSIKRTD